MDSVYIVTKSSPLDVQIGTSKITTGFLTNEAVFSTNEAAEEYIRQRKALKDRDDRGCEFHIEPWMVEHTLKKEQEEQEESDYMLSKAEAKAIARDISQMKLEANNPSSNSGYYILSSVNLENDVSLEACVCVNIEEEEFEGRRYYSLYHLAAYRNGTDIVQPDYEYTKNCTQKELANALYQLATETYSHENLAKMNEEYQREQDEIDR